MKVSNIIDSSLKKEEFHVQKNRINIENERKKINKKSIRDKKEIREAFPILIECATSNLNTEEDSVENPNINPIEISKENKYSLSPIELKEYDTFPEVFEEVISSKEENQIQNEYLNNINNSVKISSLLENGKYIIYQNNISESTNNSNKKNKKNKINNSNQVEKNKIPFNTNNKIKLNKDDISSYKLNLIQDTIINNLEYKSQIFKIKKSIANRNEQRFVRKFQSKQIRSKSKSNLKSLKAPLISSTLTENDLLRKLSKSNQDGGDVFSNNRNLIEENYTSNLNESLKRSNTTSNIILNTQNALRKLSKSLEEETLTNLLVDKASKSFEDMVTSKSFDDLSNIYTDYDYDSNNIFKVETLINNEDTSTKKFNLQFENIVDTTLFMRKFVTDIIEYAISHSSNFNIQASKCLSTLITTASSNNLFELENHSFISQESQTDSIEPQNTCFIIQEYIPKYYTVRKAMCNIYIENQLIFVDTNVKIVLDADATRYFAFIGYNSKLPKELNVPIYAITTRNDLYYEIILNDDIVPGDKKRLQLCQYESWYFNSEALEARLEGGLISNVFLSKSFSQENFDEDKMFEDISFITPTSSPCIDEPRKSKERYITCCTIS